MTVRVAATQVATNTFYNFAHNLYVSYNFNKDLNNPKDNIN